MKASVLFILLIFVLSCATQAQFSDTPNYYIHYNAGGTINKTNDGSSHILNNLLKFNFYRKSVSANTTYNWILGEQRDRLTNNDFSSILDVNLYRNERHIYYWALASFEKSFSLKINKRLQTGGGVGYYLMDKEYFVFQISNGVLYERTDLYDAETAGAADYGVLRNSFRVKFRLALLDKITLDNTDFFQHAYVNRKDYIIKSVTTFALKLQKWISLTTVVTYNKLSTTTRENLIINYGLTIERYF
jgi:hypothetical protein